MKLQAFLKLNEVSLYSGQDKSVWYITEKNDYQMRKQSYFLDCTFWLWTNYECGKFYETDMKLKIIKYS